MKASLYLKTFVKVFHLLKNFILYLTCLGFLISCSSIPMRTKSLPTSQLFDSTPTSSKTPYPPQIA